jgi:hypothetical protein
MYRVDGFDREFRSQPARFQWGATGAIARDALIELLDKSAITFLWSLKCQPSARAEDRFCALNIHMIEVAITDAQGKPATRVLYFDRCGDCPSVAIPQRQRSRSSIERSKIRALMRIEMFQVRRHAGGRIRTYEGQSPPDLQSGPLDRSGTPAKLTG